MKVKVVTPFKDKGTGELHDTNEVIDVTDKRFAEIKKAGRYVIEASDEDIAVAKTATEKSAANADTQAEGRKATKKTVKE